MDDFQINGAFLLLRGGVDEIHRIQLPQQRRIHFEHRQLLLFPITFHRLVSLWLPGDNRIAAFQQLADRRAVDVDFHIHRAFRHTARHKDRLLLYLKLLVFVAVKDQITHGVVAFLPVLLRRQMEVMDAVEQRRRVQFHAPIRPQPFL